MIHKKKKYKLVDFDYPLPPNLLLSIRPSVVIWQK